MGKYKRLLTLVLVVVIALSSSATALAAGSTDDQDILLFNGLVEYLLDTYPADADRAALLRSAMRGLIEGLGDRYSTYLSASEFRDLTQTLSGTYGGIGVTIEQLDGQFTVVAPMPGSPAERAGIRSGDIIVAVDERDVADMTLGTIGGIVRGEPGTRVVLTIIRSGLTIRIPVIRELITLQNISVTWAEDDLAVVTIAEFVEGTGINFAVVLKTLVDRGVRGIVLDMRNNPGGYVEEALAVIGQFAPGITGVQFVAKSGTAQIPTTGDGAFADLPLVVLVNAGTASASEIVAGALQDYGIAKVIGERTFGKGTVQRIATLPNGDAIKTTIAEYLTPLGGKIDGIGLKPDLPFVAQPEHEIAPYTFRSPLQIGDVSYEVLLLETVLDDLDLAPGKVDGYYNADTAYAVARIQERAGLPGTGIADAAAVRLINNAVTEQAQAPFQAQLAYALKVLAAEAAIK